MASKTQLIRLRNNQYFRGREDTLETIRQSLVDPFPDNDPVITSRGLLHSSSNIPRAFTLWGTPGQGKTQIAARFAYQNLHQFPNILFAEADTEAKLLDSYAQFAHQLGLRDKSTNTEESAIALMDFFAQTGP